MTPSARRIRLHFAWAMAVGGMIGGGIYTLAGVILGVAGPLAWLSLLLGALLALITVRSYFLLAAMRQQEGVPVTILLDQSRPRLASLVSWWLVVVYVLGLGIYAFTFGHYLGRALGLSQPAVAALIAGMVLLLVVVNLIGIEEPAGVQIVAVWIELSILAALAIFGLIHWNPQNLTAGVPPASVGGVITGMAATFIAFEGFEMIAYDYRELSSPRRIIGKGLPIAVIVVGALYALVIVGAGSLVGASVLVEQKENALAVAGEKAAGRTGLIVVTIAACVAAMSAVNATLFSVARLTRSAAERGLLPAFCARCNRRTTPHYSVILLGVFSTVVAVTASLEIMVHAASFGFLLLFGFVNALAYAQGSRTNWLSLVGAIAAAASAVVAARTLAMSHPWIFSGLMLAFLLTFGGYLLRRHYCMLRNRGTEECTRCS